MDNTDTVLHSNNNSCRWIGALVRIPAYAVLLDSFGYYHTYWYFIITKYLSVIMNNRNAWYWIFCRYPIFSNSFGQLPMPIQINAHIFFTQGLRTSSLPCSTINMLLYLLLLWWPTGRCGREIQRFSKWTHLLGKIRKLQHCRHIVALSTQETWRRHAPSHSTLPSIYSILSNIGCLIAKHLVRHIGLS